MSRTVTAGFPLPLLIFFTITGLALEKTLCAAPTLDPFRQHHDAMVAAIFDNKIDRVKALLNTPYILVNDTSYETPYLAHAVVFDRPEIATLLIDAGADVRWHNKGNRTLFHAVAANLPSDALLNALYSGLYKQTGASYLEIIETINMRSNALSGSPGRTAVYELVDRADSARQARALRVLQWLISPMLADPNIPGIVAGTLVTPLALAKQRHLDVLAEFLEDRGGHL